MNLIPKFPSFTVLYNLRLPTPITSVMWEIYFFPYLMPHRIPDRSTCMASKINTFLGGLGKS